jgi:cell division protein ZapA (FtsZ GTPase activity inhibitor)
VKRSVTVVVAGQPIALKTEAAPGYVEELAEFVNARIDEVRTAGVVNTQALALLAALNIADDLHRLRAREGKLRREVRERARRIIRTLEREAKA